MPWCAGGGLRTTPVVSFHSLPSNLFEKGLLFWLTLMSFESASHPIPRSIEITDDADNAQFYMGGVGDSNSGSHAYAVCDLPTESFSQITSPKKDLTIVKATFSEDKLCIYLPITMSRP